MKVTSNFFHEEEEEEDSYFSYLMAIFQVKLTLVNIMHFLDRPICKVGFVLMHGCNSGQMP